jgi:hypothetical protein
VAQARQSNGKTAEARELLPGTYVWFTEEFATLDLVDPKALFEELRIATNTTSQCFRWSLTLPRLCHKQPSLGDSGYLVEPSAD